MQPKIVTYTKGYLLILLKGYSPERFLNICSSKHIYIWNVEHKKNGYQFCISIEDFRRLKPIVRKTKVRLIIRNRYGFPFFLHKYRKRKLFFIGIVLSLILIYNMSLYIWDIHIEGNYTYTENNLLDFLREQNIVHGIKKSDISCEDIEKLLRNQYNDVTWVSASISGTRLIIRIQENFNDVKKEEQVEEAPQNIVAKQDGIITSIVTRAGTPMVKKGDVVAKGDVLILGIVEITDDYGGILRYEYVSADGDITGEVAYEYQDKIPIVYEKKIFTGNEKTAYAVTAFDKRLYFYAPKAGYEAFDIETEQNQLCIGTNFYLPFSLEKCYYKEYFIQSENRTEEEVEKILQKNLYNFFENLLEKGVQIVQNNVKITIDQNSGIASGKIVVDQPIGVSEILDTNIERNELADEYNGDSD